MEYQGTIICLTIIIFYRYVIYYRRRIDYILMNQLSKNLIKIGKEVYANHLHDIVYILNIKHLLHLSSLEMDYPTNLFMGATYGGMFYQQ